MEKDMMKIAIVGSRSRTDRGVVVDFVNSLPDGSVVISGGCRGVDRWAEEAARTRGLAVKVLLPDLAKCLKPWDFTRAYYARNWEIANLADKVVAFVGASRKGGTENTIRHARDLGKPVEIL